MFRLGLALVFAGALLAAPMAQAAPPPVEAYGKLPAVEHVTLSPSGERYAYIAVAGEKRTLVVATIDDKPLFQAIVGQAKVVGVNWAGEGHVLVTFSSTVPLGAGYDVDNAELSSVIVVNVDTKKLFVVFANREKISPFVEGTFGTAEVNGRWYGYFGGITLVTNMKGYAFLDHTWSDLYRVDLDTGDAEVVAKGTEVTDGWLLRPNGEIAASATYSSQHGNWQVHGGGDVGPRLVFGKNAIAGPEMEGLGRKPDHVVLRLPDDKGAMVDVEAPLAGGPTVPVADDGLMDELVFDRATGLWIGYTTFGDVAELKMFDPQTNARFAAIRKAFPGLSVRFVSWSNDYSRVVVFTSGEGDSGSYWIVSKGSADLLGLAYPDVKPADVGPIHMVDWKAADGLQLHGVLNLPPGRVAKNLPVIVMPHGGPEDRDYPVFWWWSQMFASRGYAVFQPNFRGSSGYGVAFRDAGFGQWGRKMQTDVSDGLAELVKQGIVDPKRACIAGWSYGGYAAQAGVTLQHGLYRCAVSMAGVSDLEGMLDYQRKMSAGNTSAGERYWKAFMGVTTFWENELKPYSPLNQAGQADAPLLLIHGKDDTVVPFDQSQRMSAALKSAGKPVEFVGLDHADHWLLHEDTRLAMAKASIAFVLKYNPPDPDPAATAK